VSGTKGKVNLREGSVQFLIQIVAEAKKLEEDSVKGGTFVCTAATRVVVGYARGRNL